jgi:hypothetical protein
MARSVSPRLGLMLAKCVGDSRCGLNSCAKASAKESRSRSEI